MRRCFRNKDGKRHAYWALVESYRAERGPRQRVVSYLGEMDAAGRIGIKAGVVGTHQQNLFDDVAPDWVEVDVKNVTVEHNQAFGGAWLGLEMSRAIGLPELFTQVMGRGREEIPWPLMALVLVIGRLCDPSSELHLAEHSFAAGALSELQQRRYIIGTPKVMLKQFERELLKPDWKQVREGLEVQLCPSADGGEAFILCSLSQF